MIELNMMIDGSEDEDDYECLLKVECQPSLECFQIWAADRVRGWEMIPQSCSSRKKRVHVSLN